MGVHRTWPAMARRANSISAMVTRMGSLSVNACALLPAILPCVSRQDHLLSIRPWIRTRIAVMTDSGPRKIGVSIELKPHAYDPIVNPEFFEGVLARRCIAFLIDVTIITVPVLFAAVFILVLGVITLGVGWVLYALLWPAAVIWAIVYYGLTFGSAAS